MSDNIITLKASDHEAKVLLIEITEFCNMKCPWCMPKTYDSNFGEIEKKEWSDEVKEKFINFISTHFYNIYAVTGGEPLLFWDRIEFVFSEIKKVNPNATLRICSNSTLLTPEIVKYINDNNISFITSCQANDNGIKSFEHLTKYNSNVIDYLNNISSSLFVRYVMLSNCKNVYENYLSLRKTFKNAIINITLDTSNNVVFSINDYFELFLLLKKANDSNINIDLGSVNDKFCHCWLKEHKFKSDGKLDFIRDMNTTATMGCSKTFKCFGTEQYELFRNITSDFYNKKRWNRKIYKLNNNFKVEDSVFDHEKETLKLDLNSGGIFID